MVGAIIANNSSRDAGRHHAAGTADRRIRGGRRPADSPISTAEDLANALRADIGGVTWAGGSAGGVDHIAAGLFAKAAGVPPEEINYIPYSGGGEALAAILGGQVTVGVSGFSEFSSQIEAGALKVIGITAPERQPYLDAPTFVEQGFDVDVQNWRMIAAAPGISDAAARQPPGRDRGDGRLRHLERRACDQGLGQHLPRRRRLRRLPRRADRRHHRHPPGPRDRRLMSADPKNRQPGNLPRLHGEDEAGKVAASATSPAS
jgi:hypothetical protein